MGTHSNYHFLNCEPFRNRLNCYGECNSALVPNLIISSYVWRSGLPSLTLFGKTPVWLSTLRDDLRPPASFVRPSQSERVEYIDNCLTCNHQILHGHSHRHLTSLSTSGRKLSRKTVENSTSDGLGWNFLRMI